MPISKSLIKSFATAPRGGLVESASTPSYDPISVEYFDAIDAFNPTFSTSSRDLFNSGIVTLRNAGLIDNIIELCCYGLQDRDASLLNVVAPEEVATVIGTVTAVVGGFSFGAQYSGINTIHNGNDMVAPATTFMQGAYGELMAGNFAFGNGGSVRGLTRNTSAGFPGLSQYIYNSSNFNLSGTATKNGLYVATSVSDGNRMRAYIKNSTGVQTFTELNHPFTAANYAGPMAVGFEQYYSNPAIKTAARPGLYGGHFIATGPLTVAQSITIRDAIYTMMVAAGAIVY